MSEIATIFHPGDRVVVTNHAGTWRVLRVTFGIAMLESEDNSQPMPESGKGYATPRHAAAVDQLRHAPARN